MNITHIQLSDGRELRYYDPDGAPERSAADRRGLHPTTTESQLRYDPLLDQWIMVASHRQDRIYKPSTRDCPLCPSTDQRQTEIPAEDYAVVVFQNRFPALAPSTASPTSDGTLLTRPGAGRCEVICFTPDHTASVASLKPSQVELVVAAWLDRSRALAELPGVQQVFCFENSGAEIGVTLDHPHGQIYAYPFITPRTARMLQSVAQYRERTGRNLFDDRVADEVNDGRRIVLRTEHWTAFVPHAARWPYEVHAYPNRRAADLNALDEAARAELPHVYLDLLGRFERLFATPAPYISAWHQAPVHTGREDFAVHLELFTVRRTSDKLKYLAGSESGMDAFANDVSPESAAEVLRAR
ncbi:MAG TPA: galactose-1-phosphate uridylyltransferase [Jatrophihabitans sp.]|nr:galactose-1-phosphate uridylyltransferase [Jatrophihabitans sp.]